MNLNLSVSSVKSFINKYGTLGSCSAEKILRTIEDDYKNNNIIQAELISVGM